jgi:predicted ATP-dependent endonuclease of OLD family
MPFLKKVTVRNFKCFRRETPVDLEQATLLVGPNNSGKTALLAAIRCFFDSSLFSGDDLNKTEFAAKQEGFNRADITIEFDLTIATGKTRKERLAAKFGVQLTVRKSFTYREATGTVVVEYGIGEDTYAFIEEMGREAQEVLNAVSISYIHPQEGNELLRKAQEKFKQRLFNNWGRHASVSEQLKELQEKWDELRKTANSYLSSTLTERLKLIWPHSTTKVDLPERIEEIVAVSDISFRSSSALPEITLTAQGTGAQSIVLYQTHYILDSDLSLHRGFYVPIWLLEEPESFLHTDIAVKLGNLLASDEWLESIQMIVSTHSPVILASSRKNAGRARWIVLDAHAVVQQKRVDTITDGDIEKVGAMMGDPNFDAYFTASQCGPLFFIEDIRPLTKTKIEEAGIPVTKALEGTSAVKKYVDVFRAVSGIVPKKAFFLLDNDKGLREFGSYLTMHALKAQEGRFSLYSIGNGVFMLILPKDFAVEDLFAEFEDEVEECVKAIYQDDFRLRDAVPTNLTRAASVARRKDKPQDIDQAKLVIRNEQDVKDRFWLKLEANNYKVDSSHAKAMQTLIGKAQ